MMSSNILQMPPCRQYVWGQDFDDDQAK